MRHRSETEPGSTVAWSQSSRRGLGSLTRALRGDVPDLTEEEASAAAAPADATVTLVESRISNLT